MVKVLNVPGQESGWVSVSGFVARVSAEYKQEAEKEEGEERRKGLQTLADIYARHAPAFTDLKVKVKTLRHREYLELDALQAAMPKAEDRNVAEADFAERAMELGLTAVDGVDPPGIEVGPALIDALMASACGYVVAEIIMRHHTMKPEDRAAFFT